jgi:hypothetical protein
MIPFTECPDAQGTEGWLRARMGRVTGSKAKDVLAKIKTGEAAARRDYRVALMLERLTGNPTAPGFISDEMKWGTAQEPFARMAYEARTGNIVSESGFLSCNDIAVGVSLDGAINGYQGIVEFKCPKSATHWGYIQVGKAPSDYLPQITHEMWVTGAEWCDFVSYDPRFPDNLQLFIVRVMRADVDIDGYAKEVAAFLSELDSEESKARAMTLQAG